MLMTKGIVGPESKISRMRGESRKSIRRSLEIGCHREDHPKRLSRRKRADPKPKKRQREVPESDSGNSKKRKPDLTGKLGI